ncbi:MAG: YggS family pyridoxal phosphate-dependent enzyme [Victivallales bacterium]|nr:YggS family pyridoxal phosphate-dependent enzyme [Victivallales bacterium]
MSTPKIQQRLATTQARVAEAAAEVGRPPESVRLVAVSKTVDAAAVREAYEAGQRRFGENRVQELARKVTELPDDCEWHLIGHLQKNKARAAVLAADWIHSVDSQGLLERLDRIAGEAGRRPCILLQVNITAEESKSGFTPEELPAAVAFVVTCDHLDCQGLMTMAAFDADEGILRASFARLRNLRDAMAERFGLPLPELSMGMSGDFEAAIAEGATLVRIGTAIFGRRG